jgi:hypothetical protein
MTKPEGEGTGKFHVGLDPRIRSGFNALPPKVQKELRARLGAASIDPAAVRAVLVEGQYLIDGTVLDEDKLWWYSGVRFSYDPKNHVVVLTSIPKIRLIHGIN